MNNKTATVAEIMAMTKPARIQLSRKKGFRLQDASPNGLPVVNVARPTKWGNPYTVADYGAERAVKNYRLRLHGLMDIGAVNVNELRGKNLACWCALDQPHCHADVLLEISNL